MLAPQPYQTACPRVLEQVLLDCQVGLRTGKMTTRQAEALVDATHNIPSLLEHWEECDID